MLIHSQKVKEYQFQMQLYENEMIEYKQNTRCENKLIDLFTKVNNHQEQANDSSPSDITITCTFPNVSSSITMEMIQSKHKYILNNEAKLLIKVRIGQPYISCGRLT